MFMPFRELRRFKRAYAQDKIVYARAGVPLLPQVIGICTSLVLSFAIFLTAFTLGANWQQTRPAASVAAFVFAGVWAVASLVFAAIWGRGNRRRLGLIS